MKTLVFIFISLLSGCESSTGLFGFTDFSLSTRSVQPVFSPTPAPIIRSLDQGILGFWHFDESSGSTFASSAPSTNTAMILSGSANAGVAGKVNQAIEFSNGAAQAVLPAHSFDSGVASVAFWTNWPGVDNMMPFSFNVYDIWLYSGCIGFNTANSDCLGIDDSVVQNQWAHLVFEFHAGDSTNNKIYLNGVSQSLGQFSGVLNPVGAVLSETVMFGAWQNGGRNFAGKIDEAGIWNRELTPAEVADLYSNGY